MAYQALNVAVQSYRGAMRSGQADAALSIAPDLSIEAQPRPKSPRRRKATVT